MPVTGARDFSGVIADMATKGMNRRPVKRAPVKPRQRKRAPHGHRGAGQSDHAGLDGRSAVDVL
ncbi:MAG: hypothetical protein IPK75_20235 [Acidobacteria bacterium]|nr:hypothetical protein [Acidobacteriota bacterium]